jgi:hypothetical protein
VQAFRLLDRIIATPPLGGPSRARSKQPMQDGEKERTLHWKLVLTPLKRGFDHTARPPVSLQRRSTISTGPI